MVSSAGPRLAQGPKRRDEVPVDVETVDGADDCATVVDVHRNDRFRRNRRGC